MKRKSIIVGAALIAGFVISGCANNKDIIAQRSLSTKNDVFTEIVGSEVKPGMAITDITFSVKSNSSRFLESYNKHSNPPYRVYVNIDGQTAILEAEPILEDKSPIDSNNPESGIGWKYQFNKRVALSPGKHTITIALPVDDVILEREIDLHADLNTINLMPVYNERSLRPYKGQSFTAGVKTLDF